MAGLAVDHGGLLRLPAAVAAVVPAAAVAAIMLRVVVGHLALATAVAVGIAPGTVAVVPVRDAARRPGPVPTRHLAVVVHPAAVVAHDHQPVVAAVAAVPVIGLPHPQAQLPDVHQDVDDGVAALGPD